MTDETAPIASEPETITAADDSPDTTVVESAASAAAQEPIAAPKNTIAEQDEVARRIRQSTVWPIILGGLMMGLGVASISLPLLTSLAVAIWLGWLLVGNAAIKVLYAIQTRQDRGIWLKLLLAALYLGAGVVLIVNPLDGVLTLTLLLGSFLIAEGLVELFLAIQLRSLNNWGWLVFNAMLTLLLGVFIWTEWPLDAAWVLGLLVGLSLLASGLSRVMLSLAVRRTARRMTEATA